MHMRRFVFIVLLLLALPFAAFAQDQELVWGLDSENYIDIPDLGFQFYYPLDWVYDTSNGIVFAETEDDLAAQMDDDDSTEAEGVTISVRGIPVSALPDLGDSPTLDDIVDFAVEAGGITESERIETRVLARRAIGVIGENAQERPGTAFFWLQDDIVVTASVGAPDQETFNGLLYTWGVVLGSISPLGALELGEEPLVDSISNFSISYPADWTVDPNQPSSVYESADDIGAEFADVTGSVFNLVDGALTDMGMAEDATLEDVVELIKASFTLDDGATTEEFVFLDQPALTVWGEPAADSPGAGRGIIFTIAIVEGRVIAFSLVTPSPEAAKELLPTWTAMLRSARVLEAAE